MSQKHRVTFKKKYIHINDDIKMSVMCLGRGAVKFHRFGFR